MKKRIKAVIAGTAIAGIMATAAFGLAGHAGARPVTTSVMAGFSRSSHDEGKAGGPGVDAVASVLGMTADELHMELHSGKSLATIAESKGVAVQKVIDAIVTEVKAHVADEVASGELTQAEADAKLADVTAKVTEMVNSTRPMRGEGGPRGGHDRHGRGDHHGNNLPTAAVTETND